MADQSRIIGDNPIGEGLLGQFDRKGSRSALLTALEDCIEGHESLYKAGFLWDISVNNLMVNEDNGNPSRRSFLIDLDFAGREGASGAKGKTGTRAFMAIGALFGQQHSFMHDLESFFWVLFWICIHYEGPDQDRIASRFEKWNYFDTGELMCAKVGTICDDDFFDEILKDEFSEHYQPLIPWVGRLRAVVFPDGRRWEREDLGLYARMREIIRDARNDPKVSAER
ncbi:hypothetical protein RB595_005104 [Gaeumannomyces hyphopodioides]